MTKKVKKGRFPKGHVPWNKNLKGIHLSPDSEYKKGETAGDKNSAWKGGIQYPSKDCVLVFIKSGVRGRRPRLVYEQHYGKIPSGYVIIHKDGDPYNDEPGNLEAISRSELMKRNSPKKSK